MQSILTQCPRCQTSFKVSAKQLEIAEGFVRCGSCLDVFPALANRITLKQPASADPPEDALDDAYEHEETIEEQTRDDTTASSSEITEPSISTSANTPHAEIFALRTSATRQYPVSQLVDADDVIPVNVAADVYTSSFTNHDSGLVFDDDIPLGDMVLDDADMQAGDELEVAHDADAAQQAAEEFDDEAYSASAAVYEEYAEDDIDDGAYVHEVEEEVTSPEPVARQTRADTIASYTDALMGDDDLGSTFEEEFHEQDETIVLQLDAEFTVEEKRFVASRAEEAITDEDIIPEIPATFAALATTEVDAEAAEESRPAEQSQFAPQAAFPPSALEEPRAADFDEGTPTSGQDIISEPAQKSAQHPYNTSAINLFAGDEAVAERGADASAFAQEKSAANIEADAIFRSIYDAAPPADPEPTIAPAAADESQNNPVNREALYEAYAASIPAEAGAEEPQEIIAQGFGAIRNDDDSLEPADSFTAANFSHTDEFQADEFSALTADAADRVEEFDPRSNAASRQEKAELRQYLADLEDTDALEPLPATTMDDIEAEPLTFEVSPSFRKYISTLGWFCLSLALVAVFVFQLVANNLELMQKSAVYSRYLPLFCRVLDCPAPAPVTAGIESLHAQDLLVRSHPRIPDALEVSFIFRNDAELPQPFPLLELNFRDTNKRLIANRLFKPQEYLPPELAVLDMMPALSSVQIMLELADPGSDAVDYEIIFRDAP